MAEPYLAVLSEKIAQLQIANPQGVLIECKRFFSGAALYANGRICASLTPAGLGLKLPGKLRDRLIEDGEGTELRYFERAPVKKDYVLFPQSKLDESVALSGVDRAERSVCGGTRGCPSHGSNDMTLCGYEIGGARVGELAGSSCDRDRRCSEPVVPVGFAAAGLVRGQSRSILAPHRRARHTAG